MKHPAFLIALQAIHGAADEEALDDIAELCEELWQKMRPDYLDANDLIALQEDIERRRKDIRTAGTRRAMAGFLEGRRR